MNYVLVLIGIFACSCSQIILKKSAQKKHNSIISSIFNWRVIVAYSIFLISIMINLSAMSNGLSLKELPILESSGYIFVPALSLYLLNEKLNTTDYLAIVIILFGITIFYA